MIQVIPVEFNRIDDLLQDYFREVRRYNRELGAFDMTAAELADAQQREAANYARVKRAKEKLLQAGIPV